MRELRRPDTTFWVDRGAVEGERLSLDSEESRHLLRVHRASPGCAFTAVDGAGVTYECLLESVDEGAAIGRILSRAEGQGELTIPILLLVGLPDPGPVESVVAHAVPLGVTAIDFVASARSGRPPLSLARLDRLSRIARSALKQSRRSRLPEIRSSSSLESAMGHLAPGSRFVASPTGNSRIPQPPKGIQGLVALAVGPPGGFDDREGASLSGANFSSISLGPSRLSTETAAIALLITARNLLY